MKTRGFTLLELLAVIVILAILALIALPTILNVVEAARVKAIEASALGYVNAVNKQIAINLLDEDLDDIVKGTYTVDDLSKYNVVVKGTTPSSGEIVINSEVSTAILCISNYKVEYKDNKAKAEKNSSCNVDEKELYKELVLNGTDPVLDEGMIAVTIAADGTVKKSDLYSEWYNYNEKQWANAVLVNQNVRETYSSGDIIPENEILAYFVWIPRYKYKLFNVNGDVIQPLEIEIVFESENIEKSIGMTNGEYLTHPAFTYGNEEINGLWVGKFETTGNETLPTIKPNMTSLRNQNVSTQFKTSLIFGNRTINNDGSITNNSDKVIYGLASESRMMKNSEWGSIMYLSHSKYGINGEVRINNNHNFITGCGAAPGSKAESTTCEMQYDKVTNYLQSTTGNISGIFDMSGGAWEYTMSLMETSLNNKIPFSGYNVSYNSGFQGAYTQGGNNTAGVIFPNEKYYNIYTYGTTYNDGNAYNRRLLGDGTSETRGWYGDFSNNVDLSGTIMIRGGQNSDSENAGIVGFTRYGGNKENFISFRTVIIAN